MPQHKPHQEIKKYRDTPDSFETITAPRATSVGPRTPRVDTEDDRVLCQVTVYDSALTSS